MNLSVEILSHILHYADTSTLATFRTACWSLNRMIANDLSLCWHGDQLRHKLDITDSPWGALALLGRYDNIVRAAPSHAPYFEIKFDLYNTRELGLSADHLKLLDARLRHICIIIIGHGEIIENLEILFGLKCVESIIIDGATVNSFTQLPALKTLRIERGNVSHLPLRVMHLSLSKRCNAVRLLTPAVGRNLQVLKIKAVYISTNQLKFFLERISMPLLRELSIIVRQIDIRRPDIKFPAYLTHLDLTMTKILPGAANGENFCFSRMANLRVLKLCGDGIQGVNCVVWPPVLRVLYLDGYINVLNVNFPTTLKKLYVRNIPIEKDALIQSLPSKCSLVHDYMNLKKEKNTSDVFYF